MLRPSFRYVLIYFLLKYFAFYTVLMFKNNDFYFVKPGIRNADDLFWYFWMLLILPLIAIAFFSLPLYYSFRQKKLLLFIFIIIAFLVSEYFLYTYMASESDLTNGFYNGILSIIFLLLLFFKAIRRQFMIK